MWRQTAQLTSARSALVHAGKITWGNRLFLVSISCHASFNPCSEKPLNLVRAGPLLARVAPLRLQEATRMAPLDPLRLHGRLRDGRLLLQNRLSSSLLLENCNSAWKDHRHSWAHVKTKEEEQKRGGGGHKGGVRDAVGATFSTSAGTLALVPSVTKEWSQK